MAAMAAATRLTEAMTQFASKSPGCKPGDSECRIGLQLSTPPVVESSSAGDQKRGPVMRVKVFLEVTAEDGSTSGAAEVCGVREANEAGGGPWPLDRRGQGADG